MLDLRYGYGGYPSWAVGVDTVMAATFEEMKAHEGHEVELIVDGFGDINLYCSDCADNIETWEKPPEPLPWQGQRYFKETGDEPNIGDIIMEKGEK